MSLCMGVCVLVWVCGCVFMRVCVYMGVYVGVCDLDQPSRKWRQKIQQFFVPTVNTLDIKRIIKSRKCVRKIYFPPVCFRFIDNSMSHDIKQLSSALVIIIVIYFSYDRNDCFRRN